MTITLASGSPRRLELCRQIGLDPVVVRVEVDESPLRNEKPRDYATRVARLKAEAGLRLVGGRPGDVLIAGDTVVAVGRRILHKTDDSTVARSHLRLLSGRSHRVWGALEVRVCQADGWQRRVRVSETRVRFTRLDEDEIADYLAGEEWQGVAGAYAIQGRAAAYIAALHGSCSNVVGLDLHRLWRLLPPGVFGG